MNFKKLAIYPYHPASGSAKLLASYMGIKRIKHTNSRWNGRGKVVINWGSTNLQAIGSHNPSYIINRPLYVGVASNKLKFFQYLGEQRGVSYLPAWTSDRSTALQWIEDGCTVLCRTLVSSSEGEGIVLASTPEELVHAPLFTKYVKKKAEYRIHVMNGVVIDAQQKKKRVGHEGGDNRVRNTANGYVFCRNGVVVPDQVKEVAVQCVADLHLDFGGVDVIWNEHYQKAYVLEVNTAPGIEGTTLKSYADGISAMVTPWIGV